MLIHGASSDSWYWHRVVPLLQRLDELWVFDGADDPAGFRRVLVTEPGDPWLEAWWPPGHIIGWEHTFVHQLRDLLVDIARGTDPTPSFDDGLALQRIIDAVLESARSGRRVEIGP